MASTSSEQTINYAQVPNAFGFIVVRFEKLFLLRDMLGADEMRIRPAQKDCIDFYLIHSSSIHELLLISTK